MTRFYHIARVIAIETGLFLRRRHFEETFYSYNTIRTIAAVALWLVQVLAINGLAISIVAVLDAIIVAAYWLVISVQLFRETPLGALNLFYILLYLITLEIIPLTGIVLWYKKY